MVPLHAVLVQQKAHQFGHGNARVGVVQLETVLLRKGGEVPLVDHLPAGQHILQAGGGEEILLPQAQFLAVFAGIVGVEHHGDVFRLVLARHRFGVAAGIELAQVELGGCRRFPEPQGVDRAVAISGHRYVVGYGEHVVGIDPADAQLAVAVTVILAPAAVMDPLGVFCALQFPRIAAAQPLVGLLHLLAVLYLLAEHAVLVTDAVTGDRQLQGGATVEETGRQPPQAAIAEPGIVLRIHQLLKFEAETMERLFDAFRQPQVEDGVSQGSPHEEFEGEVVAPLAVRLLVGVAGIFPPFHQAVADRQGKRLVEIVDRAAVAIPPQVIGVVVAKTPGNAGVVHGEGRRVGQGRAVDPFSFFHVVHGYPKMM